MVRFLVPSGDGQHDLEPGYPLHNIYAHETPKRICLFAVVVTGALSILGRSRPGTFLRSVAYLTPVLAADYAILETSHADVKKVVLRKDGITDIKPPKLVEWTSTVCLDDWALGGAVIGVGLARLRRPFPGASGWTRYLGASQVGWMAGSISGAFIMQKFPGYREAKAQETQAHERAMNASIKHGVMALITDPAITGWKSWYSVLQVKYHIFWNTPFRGLGHAISDAQTDLPAPAAPPGYSRGIHFERHVLAGCDHDGVSSTYEWKPDGDSIPELKSYIDRLKELRVEYDLELQHIHRILARKERAFYAMTSEDPVKIKLQKQVVMLDSVVENVWLEVSAIDYRIASSTRLLDLLAKAPVLRHDPLLDSHAPYMATLKIRQAWDHVTNVHSTLHAAKFNPQVKEAMKQNTSEFKTFEEMIEHVRQHVEATEGLLKEFELRIQKFESGDQEAFERLLKELEAPLVQANNTENGR